jgi:predicted nucleic acid-binding protein
MQVCLLGAIRQEILSGLRDPAQFEKLRAHLRAFPDFEVTTADHERAAEFFNLCRGRGVQGSNTDFLICAVAERRGLSIFSADADFASFAMHLPIELHAVRS